MGLVVTGYLLLVIGLFRIPAWWSGGYWLSVICYWLLVCLGFLSGLGSWDKIEYFSFLIALRCFPAQIVPYIYAF